VGVLANGAIGLGLLVEYLVIGKVIDATKEAERASNERIAGIEERAAEANARASEAQLALEKYKARRHLTQDQWLRIVARISEYGPQQFDMAVNNADPEAQRIATSIFHHLWTLAKWHPIHWVQPGVMVVQWEPPGGPIPNWGINTMTFGVVVQIIPSERGQFVGVASALVIALFDEGIAATVDVIGSHSTNKDTIHILVGRKP